MSNNFGAYFGILIGWPFVITGLLISIFAIVKKSPNLLFLTAIMLLPMSFYLSGANSLIEKLAILVVPVTIACRFTLKNHYLKNTIFLASLPVLFFFLYRLFGAG